jgi:hypothetical protein
MKLTAKNNYTAIELLYMESLSIICNTEIDTCFWELPKKSFENAKELEKQQMIKFGVELLKAYTHEQDAIKICKNLFNEKYGRNK